MTVRIQNLVSSVDGTEQHPVNATAPPTFTYKVIPVKSIKNGLSGECVKYDVEQAIADNDNQWVPVGPKKNKKEKKEREIRSEGDFNDLTKKQRFFEKLNECDSRDPDVKKILVAIKKKQSKDKHQREIEKRHMNQLKHELKASRRVPVSFDEPTGSAMDYYLDKLEAINVSNKKSKDRKQRRRTRVFDIPPPAPKLTRQTGHITTEGEDRKDDVIAQTLDYYDKFESKRMCERDRAAGVPEEDLPQRENIRKKFLIHRATKYGAVQNSPWIDGCVPTPVGDTLYNNVKPVKKGEYVSYDTQGRRLFNNSAGRITDFTDKPLPEEAHTTAPERFVCFVREKLNGMPLVAELIETFGPITTFFYQLYRSRNLTDAVAACYCFFTWGNLLDLSAALGTLYNKFKQWIDVVSKAFSKPQVKTEGWIDNLEYFNNILDTLLTSKVVKALRDIIVTVVAWRLFNTQITERVFHLFGQPESTTIMNTITTGLASVVILLKCGRNLINGSSVVGALFAEDPISKIINDIKLILKLEDYLYVGLPVPGKIHILDFVVQAQRLNDNCLALMKKSNPTKPNYKILKLNQADLQGAIIRTKQIMASLNRSFPIGAIVSGTTKVGKSKYQDVLVAGHCVVTGRKYSKNLIHTQSCKEDGFDEGYDPFTKPYIRMPELFNLPVHAVKARGDTRLEGLCALMDNQPLLVPSAFQNKGKLYYIPEMVYGDTNCTDFYAYIINAVTHVDAVLRRHLEFTPQLKPEFCLPGTQIIDEEAALAAPNPLNIWRHFVYEYVPRPGVGRESIEKVLIFQTDDIDTFNTWWQNRIRFHIQQQANIANIVDQAIKEMTPDTPDEPMEAFRLVEQEISDRLSGTTPRFRDFFSRLAFTDITDLARSVFPLADYSITEDIEMQPGIATEGDHSDDDEKYATPLDRILAGQEIVGPRTMQRRIRYASPDARENIPCWQKFLIGIMFPFYCFFSFLDALYQTMFTHAVTVLTEGDTIELLDTYKYPWWLRKWRQFLFHFEKNMWDKYYKRVPPTRRRVNKGFWSNVYSTLISVIQWMRMATESLAGYTTWTLAHWIFAFVKMIDGPVHSVQNYVTILLLSVAAYYLRFLFLMPFGYIILINVIQLPVAKELAYRIIQRTITNKLCKMRAKVSYVFFGDDDYNPFYSEWWYGNRSEVQPWLKFITSEHFVMGASMFLGSYAVSRFMANRVIKEIDAYAKEKTLEISEKERDALHHIFKHTPHKEEMKIEHEAVSNFTLDSEYNEKIQKIEELMGCGESYKRVKNKINPAIWNIQEIPVSTNKHRGDFDSLFLSISRNLRSVDINNGEYKTLMFGLCQNYALINVHTLGKTPTSFLLKSAPFGMHVGLASITRNTHVGPKDIHLLGNDLALIRVNEQFADKLKHLNDIPIPDQPIRGFIKPHKTWVRRCDREIPVITKGTTDFFRDLVEYDHEGHLSGMCGTPLLIQNGRSISIGAIHTAGSTSDSTCYATIVPRDKILEHINEWNKDYHVVSEGNYEHLQLVAPNPKSVTHYLEMRRLRYLGKVPGNVNAKGVSRLVSEPLGPRVAKFLLDSYGIECNTKFGRPMMSAQGSGDNYINPYNVGLIKMELQHATFTSSTIDFISELMFKHALEAFDKYGIHVIEPLTLLAAVNGPDDDAFIRRINVATSGGFGFPGKKIEYLVKTSEEPLIREPTDELKEKVFKRYECYMRGESCPAVYNVSLKDEPRKMSKCLTGQTRLFYIAPLDFLAVSKMLLTPILSHMAEYPDIFGSAIGINTHRDIDSLLSEMKVLDTEDPWVILAGDVERFDVSIPLPVRVILCKLLYKLMIHFYTTVDKRIITGFLTDLLFVHICVLRDLLVAMGIQPSGDNLTAEINTILLRIIMYLFWYCNDTLKTHDIRLLTVMRNYGDDFNTSVPKWVSEHMNNITIRDFMKESLNMTYTPSVKDAEMIPYETVKEASFLKRHYIFRADLGRWMAPLDIDSIIKSLCWRNPSETVTREHQFQSTLNSALYEFFIHFEREKFNVLRKYICTVLEEMEPDYQYKLVKFDEIYGTMFPEDFL